jgi:DNA-directed RNA polymerase subunit RPC12/RpoP
MRKEDDVEICSSCGRNKDKNQETGKLECLH